jgi:hypothetical protein
MRSKAMMIFVPVLLSFSLCFSKKGHAYQTANAHTPDEDGNSLELFSEIAREHNEDNIPFIVFNADYDTVWKVVLSELSHLEFKNLNKLLGHIKTRWIDDTLTQQELEPQRQILASRYSLTMQLIRSNYHGKNICKLTVYKNWQQILKEGEDFASVKSTGETEKVLFYRLKRHLALHQLTHPEVIRPNLEKLARPATPLPAVEIAEEKGEVIEEKNSHRKEEQVRVKLKQKAPQAATSDSVSASKINQTKKSPLAIPDPEPLPPLESVPEASSPPVEQAKVEEKLKDLQEGSIENIFPEYHHIENNSAIKANVDDLGLEEYVK